MILGGCGLMKSDEALPPGFRTRAIDQESPVHRISLIRQESQIQLKSPSNPHEVAEKTVDFAGLEQKF
jgi:hypothetical protein